MQDIIGLLLIDQDGSILRNTLPEVSHHLLTSERFIPDKNVAVTAAFRRTQPSQLCD